MPLLNEQKKMKKLISITSLVCLLFACDGNRNKVKNIAPEKPVISPIDYSLVNSFPHDTTAFTEGFLIYNGKLYESTGASRELPQTRSLFGVVDLKTGKIEKKVELDKTMYFGEGITFLNGKVYQLTYKTRVGFIYDASSFKKLGQFTFPSDEG